MQDAISANVVWESGLVSRVLGLREDLGAGLPFEQRSYTGEREVSRRCPPKQVVDQGEWHFLNRHLTSPKLA